MSAGACISFTSMTKVLETPDAATLLVSLARNIPGAIYRCALDAEWTMHLIGDEIERITGYPAEDFIHNRRRTYGSVIHPDDRAQVERSVGRGRERTSVRARVPRLDRSRRGALGAGTRVR